MEAILACLQAAMQLLCISMLPEQAGSASTSHEWVALIQNMQADVS